MQFIIECSEIYKAISFVSGAVERRHSLSILSNVLLEVHEAGLNVVGTDLEIELRARVEIVDCSREGRITVPAKKLFDICKSLPSESQVIFEVQGDKVLLKCGRSKFSLSTLDADEFPQTLDDEHQFTLFLAQDQLNDLLGKTAFSMAMQDVRYYLNGLMMELNGERVTAVSSDGHRLAVASAEVENVDNPRQMIIPRKAVNEIQRMLGSGEEDIELTWGENHFRVKHLNFVLIGKLIDGRFPDYKRLLPKNNQIELLLDRGEIKQAIQRALVLSNEKLRRVIFNLSHNQLRIISSNAEKEEAEEVLMVDYQYEEMEIGLNGQYVLDVLNVLKQERVKFCITNPDTSVLIEGEGSDDSMYVVMPMRI